MLREQALRGPRHHARLKLSHVSFSCKSAKTREIQGPITRQRWCPSKTLWKRQREPITRSHQAGVGAECGGGKAPTCRTSRMSLLCLTSLVQRWMTLAALFILRSTIRFSLSAMEFRKNT